MSDIQLFNYESNEIRVIEIEDESWFVAKDVCNVLGLSDVYSALRRLDDDETLAITDKIKLAALDAGSSANQLSVINESGLYNLILRSDKPNAKSFKKWITKDVIPSIRKHGYYVTPINNQDILLNAINELTSKMNNIEINYVSQVNLLSETIKEKNEQIDEYKEEQEELKEVLLKYPGLNEALNYFINTVDDDECFTLKDYLSSKKINLSRGQRIIVGRSINSWTNISQIAQIEKVNGISIYTSRHIALIQLAIRYVFGFN